MVGRPLGHTLPLHQLDLVLKGAWGRTRYHSSWSPGAESQGCSERLVPWQMAWGTEHVLQAGLRAEKGLGGNPGSGVGRPGVLHTLSEPQFLRVEGSMSDSPLCLCVSCPQPASLCLSTLLPGHLSPPLLSPKAAH